MKRVFLVFGSFVAVGLTVALFIALTAAVVFVASAPQRLSTRQPHHNDLMYLPHGG